MRIFISLYDALRTPWSSTRRFIRHMRSVLGRGIQALLALFLLVLKSTAALGSLVLVGLFALYVWDELWHPKVEIVMAPAPEALEARGYSGNILARKIRNSVDRIYRDAHRPIPFATYEIGERFPLINEAQPYLFSAVMPEPTFNFALSWARRFVGATRRTISGHVICSDEDCADASGIRLSIGVQGMGLDGWIYQVALSDESDMEIDMEAAIDRIAMQVVEIFDPIATARYHFRIRNFAEAERLAAIGMQEFPDRADAARFILVAMAIEEEDFDLARGYLASSLTSDKPEEIRARARINEAVLDARQARIRPSEGVESLRKQLERPLAALREVTAMDIKPRTARADIFAIAQANIGVNLLNTFNSNAPDDGRAVLAEARAAFEESIKFDATNPMPRYYLGEIDRRQCEFRAATHRYYHVLALDPDYGIALRGQGFAYRRVALQASTAVSEEATPSEVATTRARGKALMERAVMAYKRALELELDDSRHITHMNLAVALIDLDRTVEAKEHLEQSLDISPGYDRAHFYLGWVNKCACRFDDALTNLEAARNRPLRSTADQQRLKQVYEVLLALRDRAESSGQPLRNAAYWREVRTGLDGLDVDGAAPDECQIFPPALQCDTPCAELRGRP